MRCFCPQHATALSVSICHTAELRTAGSDTAAEHMSTVWLPVPAPLPAYSYFEMEQEEYAKRGVTLSVEAWLVKLMVRARGRKGRHAGVWLVAPQIAFIAQVQPALHACLHVTLQGRCEPPC